MILKKKYLLTVIIINALLILMVGALFFFQFSESKIVYVDTAKLFEGFNMTKDLENLNKEKVTSQKKKMDSLYTIYSIFKKEENDDKIKELEAQLRQEDQVFRQMRESLSRAGGKQIWDRLHQYIKEYGVSKNYKIILGTQGNSTVLFAEDGMDITNDIIEYTNHKYEGN